LMDPDDAGVRFAAPLRYLAGRSSYIFWEPRPSTEGVAALVSSAQAAGRPVYYLSSRPSGAARMLADYRPETVDRFAVTLPELERTSSYRPRLTNPFTAHFTLFRLGSRLTPAPQALPVAIDVGMEDFPGYALLNDGFYLWEVASDGTSFRWTGAAASLTIPPETAPRYFAFRVASGKPDREGSTTVRLSCGVQEWARFQAGGQFDVYTFALDGRCFTLGERTLTISSDPWSPAELGAGTDKRTLGIMLDWVRFY
ncbi:MAG TPA: hypothetical protein VJM51_02740, partial [Dehalococcoidia bacterium]|nr:hypothetical protein [Dehalococcoidia bacterium]